MVLNELKVWVFKTRVVLLLGGRDLAIERFDDYLADAVSDVQHSLRLWDFLEGLHCGGALTWEEFDEVETLFRAAFRGDSDAR